MKTKLVEYECPRCGYDTSDKTKMHLHLYKRKLVCCSLVSDIILSDDIKMYILNNRIYKPNPVCANKLDTCPGPTTDLDNSANELDTIKQITTELVKFNQEYVCPFQKQSALLLKLF